RLMTSGGALFAEHRSQNRFCSLLHHRTPARRAILRRDYCPSDIAGLAPTLSLHGRRDISETVSAQQRLQFAVGPPLVPFELAQISGVEAAQAFEYFGPLLETRRGGIV